MQFSFEKQFGTGVDPWYAQAKRWAKKQRFPINHLALGLVAWLTKVWIDAKIYNTMRSVDRQAKSIVQDWEEQDDRANTRHIVEKGVFGDEGWSIGISNPAFEGGTKISVPKLVTPSNVRSVEKDERNTTRPRTTKLSEQHEGVGRVNQEIPDPWD